MKKLSIIVLLFACLVDDVVGQITVESTDGYSVHISVEPVKVIPDREDCTNGYNYNVELAYKVSFSGTNIPGGLYNLQGYLGCENNSMYFDLPNSGGEGSTITNANPWRSTSDCGIATPESLDCFSSSQLVIEGPGIASQTITFNPTTLPVNLLYFKAKAHQESIEINWASSKAWDFSHYELERSADGNTFDYVTTIDAEENTNGTIEYSYSDRQPISGTSYYRLKAVDIDGALEYKEVAVVKFGAESFKVYPNPSNLGYINIYWSHATDGTSASLRDSAGRVVRSAQISERNNTISTEGLSVGMYLLSVQGPTGTQQAQVVIR